MYYTQGVDNNMETKLARIAEVAKANPQKVFTSLYHLINIELLYQCYQELSNNKVAGVNEITKAEYEANLSENLSNLVYRLKQMAY